jgi:5'-phosphate synthase pdxT subunit
VTVSNQLLYLFINSVRKMIVGVLAVQGSFAEHIHVLNGLVEEARLVRKPSELKDLDALIIPGGESTTIGEFLNKRGLATAMNGDLPIFGTCAGLIVLANKLTGKKKEGQGLLKRLEIEVERNAYGRQTESFEDEVRLTWSSAPFRGVFIRAPKILKYSPDVKVLAWRKKTPVLVRQGNNLACAFHPELTSDSRVHKYFIEKVVKS